VDSALPWPSRNDDNANEVADVAAVGGTTSSGEGVPSVADYDGYNEDVPWRSGRIGRSARRSRCLDSIFE